jgi:cytochrome c biogenesis protein CcdA
MEFGFATYALGFVAGAASVLSPCVLPLLPILVASALSKHRWGTVALALGLSLSFALVGIFIATLGASLGLDGDTFRRVAAGLMVLFGWVMISARLQSGFVKLSARLGAAGQQVLGSVKGDGLSGQFLIGLLLGLVWSPCVGPTLGAATTLAAQGRSLAHITLLMIVFGVGAGLPLMLIGAVSRASATRVRGSLATFGKRARLVLGGLFVVLGMLVLSGFDRQLEAMLLWFSPNWLTALTTSI